MLKILVLRSGGVDLPPEASGPDVALLTTHEVVPCDPGIAQAFSFDPRGARLVVSSGMTVGMLLRGTRNGIGHPRGSTSDAAEAASSTGFFEKEFSEVIAVGEETAAAVRAALSLSRGARDGRAVPERPVVVPPTPGAAGVLHLLRESPAGLPGSRILWPRGSDADPAPIEELRALGARVTAPVVYEKRPRPFSALDAPERALLWEFLSGAFGAIAVGSLAALDAFLALLGNRASGTFPQVRWGVLGPQTARALVARGFPEPAVPSRARFADLIELLRKERENPTP